MVPVNCLSTFTMFLIFRVLNRSSRWSFNDYRYYYTAADNWAVCAYLLCDCICLQLLYVMI